MAHNKSIILSSQLGHSVALSQQKIHLGLRFQNMQFEKVIFKNAVKHLVKSQFAF
jgi:hypothetical protein